MWFQCKVPHSEQPVLIFDTFQDLNVHLFEYSSNSHCMESVSSNLIDFQLLLCYSSIDKECNWEQHTNKHNESRHTVYLHKDLSLVLLGSVLMDNVQMHLHH